MIKVESLLQHFSAEVDGASQAFFLWKGINNLATDDREIYRILNEQALSWNILTRSLQTTFFIVLGRLFDTDKDAFSAQAFLKGCIDNIEQFSKDALRKRKLEHSPGTVPEWLENYIEEAYVPEIKDFKILRGELSKQQKHYEKIYRPIRNMVMAHKDAAIMDNVESLFGKTRIEDIEKFLCFLHQIKMVIFHLLHNGMLTKIGDYSFNEEQYVVNDIRALLEKLKA